MGFLLAATAVAIDDSLAARINNSASYLHSSRAADKQSGGEHLWKSRIFTEVGFKNRNTDNSQNCSSVQQAIPSFSSCDIYKASLDLWKHPGNSVQVSGLLNN